MNLFQQLMRPQVSALSADAPGRWRLCVWGLALGCLILHLTGSGGYDLFTDDEIRYAVAGRRMLETGDWVIPEFNGSPRYQNPILFYWLQATSMAIFGAHPWAARIPAALAGTGVVLMNQSQVQRRKVHGAVQDAVQQREKERRGVWQEHPQTPEQVELEERLLEQRPGDKKDQRGEEGWPEEARENVAPVVLCQISARAAEDAEKQHYGDGDQEHLARAAPDALDPGRGRCTPDPLACLLRRDTHQAQAHQAHPDIDDQVSLRQQCEVESGETRQRDQLESYAAADLHRLWPTSGPRAHAECGPREWSE